MSDVIGLIWALVVDLFRSRAALEAEVLVLRQQIVALRQANPAAYAGHQQAGAGMALLVVSERA
jgi:hypothetical protein